MDELIISPYLLGVLFLVVSSLYSSVGLGGGSSYTALLAILGASHAVIPGVSLTLNAVVTLLGSINYIRQGHARFRLIAAFVVTSVPMAYLGGSLEIAPQLFYAILLATLVLVALRIYLVPDPKLDLDLGPRTKIIAALLIGAILGLIAGIVGIGGGIYLVPIIIILGLGDAKEAAATGAIFIFVNSLGGLAAHLQRGAVEPAEIWPLVVAVVLGGFIGSHLGAARFEKETVRRVLGVVILFAIVLLTRRVF
ncbi:MAG: sulfite exporter TauE/SafE family protein [Persicimonas sp.]